VQQPLISPRVALTLVIALWGFAGWLDRPVQDLGAEPEPVVSDVPSMQQRCVVATPETTATHRAQRRLRESLTFDANVSADLDSSHAALLRCRIDN